MGSWLDADHIRHYEGAVAKINVAGVEVLSSEVQEFYDGMPNDVGTEILRRFVHEPALPPLGRVANVVTAVVDTTIVITWDATHTIDRTALTGYRMQMLATPPGSGYVDVGTGDPDTRTFTYPGPLVSGTEYVFSVRPHGYVAGVGDLEGAHYGTSDPVTAP